MKRIAIFADIQNINDTTRHAFDRQFNYRAFWQHISTQGDIVSAVAYTIFRNNDKQRQFLVALKQIGFDIKRKPFIQRANNSRKGDWDVGIAIDILHTAKHVDIVVLLSGDEDFDLLLEKIRQDSTISAEVYGVPSLTAMSLIDAASIYHPIGDQLLL
ncbi:MAG: NYN domain-containing protein [Gammaproteobacteria bacterium]|jgi:uncharacterized LabA/DUF88 family protein